MSLARVLQRLQALDTAVQPEEILFRFGTNGALVGGHFAAKILSKVDPNDPDEKATWRHVGPFDLPAAGALQAGSPVRQVLAALDVASVNTVNANAQTIATLQAQLQQAQTELAELKASQPQP